MFPLRKFHIEQIFVLVRMELRNDADTQPVKRFKRYKGYALQIYDIKFGLLLVRENEISVRKWSVGLAHWRTLEGMLPGIHDTLMCTELQWCHWIRAMPLDENSFLGAFFAISELR